MPFKKTIVALSVLSIAALLAGCNKPHSDTETKAKPVTSTKDKPLTKGGAKEKQLPEPPSPFQGK